jgi:hypothetical protein
MGALIMGEPFRTLVFTPFNRAPEGEAVEYTLWSGRSQSHELVLHETEALVAPLCLLHHSAYMAFNEASLG